MNIRLNELFNYIFNFNIFVKVEFTADLLYSIASDFIGVPNKVSTWVYTDQCQIVQNLCTKKG